MELELLEAPRLGTPGQLAGGLAGEINNTLEPVFSLAGLCLDQTDLPDRTRERVEKIVAAAERGRNISRRALIYSAEREGDTLPVYLSETITDILAFLDETTICSLRIDPVIGSSSATVRVQPTKLMQVLTNLVTNSADVMNSKGIVRVSCDYPSAEDDPLVPEFPDSRDVARISVADHGVGMKEGIRQRVFEPFFQPRSRGRGLDWGYRLFME
jgi:signal transduction histidine kinase